MKPPDVTRDTGLAAMLASAQPGDHAVLADWVEEHLHLDDLAAALRMGQDNPFSPGEEQSIVYESFRYRLLDRHVLLYLSGYQLWPMAARGRKGMEVIEGRLLGLCLSHDGLDPSRRLTRWFPRGAPCAALDSLWEALARDRPTDSQPR